MPCHEDRFPGRGLETCGPLLQTTIPEADSRSTEPDKIPQPMLPTMSTTQQTFRVQFNLHSIACNSAGLDPKKPRKRATKEALGASAAEI